MSGTRIPGTSSFAHMPSTDPTSSAVILGGRNGGGGRRRRVRSQIAKRVMCNRMHPRIDTQAVVHVTFRADLRAQIRRRAKPTPYPMNDVVSPGLFNLLKGELAFSTRDVIRRSARKATNRNPNMHAVPVWTAFNGFDIENQDMVFQGVVVKGFHGGDFTQTTPGDEPTVTVQASGTTTIFNPGKQPINAGNIVYWEPSDVEDDHPTTLFNNDTPANKFLANVSDTAIPQRIGAILDSISAGADSVDDVRARVKGYMPKPFVSALGTYFDEYGDLVTRDEVAGLARSVDSLVDRISQAMTGLGRLSCDLHAAALNQRIGKALTSAAPGESFDILIG